MTSPYNERQSFAANVEPPCWDHKVKINTMDSYEEEMRDVGVILHDWFPKRRDLCKETMAYIVYAGRISEDVFKLVVITNNSLLKYSGSSNLTKEKILRFVEKPLETPLTGEEVVKISIFLTGTDAYTPWLEIRNDKSRTTVQTGTDCTARLTVHSSRKFLSETVISTFVGGNTRDYEATVDTLEVGRVVGRDIGECHLCIAGQLILTTTTASKINCVVYDDGSIVTTTTVEPGAELFMRGMDMELHN